MSPAHSESVPTDPTPWLALFLVLVLMCLYGSTASRVLSISHDSIAYLSSIESETNLFHPHHLLYNPLAIYWLKACRGLGLAAENILLLSILSSLFGAGTVCLFFLILRRRLGLGAPESVIASFLPALSFGHWFYSGSIEVYIVPLFFIMLALYVVSAGKPHPRRYALIGVVHGTSILFHQLHVFFVPALLTYCFLSAQGTRRAWQISALSYLGAVAITVAGSYLAVAFLVLDLRPDEVPYWLTLYLHESEYWSRPGVVGAAKALVGFGRGLVGGHFLFAVPGIDTWLTSALGGHWLQDEQFLIRDLRPGSAALIAAGAGVLGVGILTSLAVCASRIPRVWSDHLPLVSAVTVWLLLYSGFFLFWQPENVEFWIPQIMAFWLLFSGFWLTETEDETGARWTRLSITVGLVLLLGSVNYFGSIRHTQKQENDYYYSMVAPFAQATERDLVIIGRRWMIEGYARRYSRASVVSLPTLYEAAGSRDRFTKGLEKLISQTLAGGGEVFVSGEAVNPDAKTLETWGTSVSAAGAIWNRYKQHWTESKTDLTIIFLIRAGPAEHEDDLAISSQGRRDPAE